MDGFWGRRQRSIILMLRTWPMFVRVPPIRNLSFNPSLNVSLDRKPVVKMISSQFLGPHINFSVVKCSSRAYRSIMAW